MSIPAARFQSPVLTVSELTAQVKSRLEASFGALWVQGEISGLKLHSSGHCYFSLKDSQSQINCTLWRSQVARLRFRPSDGLEVLAQGRLNVYPPRGTYSLNVQRMEPQGVGDLQLAFEQLKRKLAAEGLFEQSRKRRLPFLATRIGVVTSPTGAALQDILKVIHRRNPRVSVVVSPARVQGEGSAPEIARAIRRLNRYGKVDVIIAGRGGGSMEDLWCFNEEAVARAIATSSIPVVSAVGHEVDFTISDFVSDLRAPTPSAAAELVVKDRAELEMQIGQLRARLERAILGSLQRRKIELMGLSERLRSPRAHLADQRRRLESLENRLMTITKRDLASRRQSLAALSSKLQLLSPSRKLQQRRELVAGLREQLNKAMRTQLKERRSRFEQAVAKLDALSPLAILGRGYAIAQRSSDSKVLYRSDEVSEGEELRLRLHQGSLDCRVERVEGAEG